MKKLVLSLVFVALAATAMFAQTTQTTTCVATTEELKCCVTGHTVGTKVYNQQTQTYWVYCKNGKWANEGRMKGDLMNYMSVSPLVNDNSKMSIACGSHESWTITDSYSGLTNQDMVSITVVGDLSGLSISWWIQDGELKVRLKNISNESILVGPMKINTIIWRLE